jgi:hypothetical protein
MQLLVFEPECNLLKLVKSENSRSVAEAAFIDSTSKFPYRNQLELSKNGSLTLEM